jgi:hypothetical protein
MINIPNFEVELKGKKFKDTSLGASVEYVVVGYGDNQGNPYLIGLTDGGTPDRTFIKTVLLKNVEFIS